VDQTKPDSVSLQVDGQGPIEMAVAISPDDRYGRPEIFDNLKNPRRADVAEMPDLIRLDCERFQIRRQFIVSVGQDENAKRRRHCLFFAYRSCEGCAFARARLCLSCLTGGKLGRAEAPLSE